MKLITTFSLSIILYSCNGNPKNEKITNKENYKVILSVECKRLQDFNSNIQEIAKKENFNEKTYTYQTGNWNETKTKTISNSYYGLVEIDNDFLSDLLSERDSDVDSNYKEKLLNSSMIMKGRANLYFLINGEYYDKPKVIKLERNLNIDKMLIGPVPDKPSEIVIATGNYNESKKLK